MDGLGNSKKAIPDGKQTRRRRVQVDHAHSDVLAKWLYNPNPQKTADILTVTEYIRYTKISKEASDYIEKLSLNDIKWKTHQDFLDEMTLFFADEDTPSKLPPNPTDEQRAAERQRRLNALTTRHRIIFSTWPRDPQTKHVIKSGSENTIIGKTAIEGHQLWGASLFDFYKVYRHPSMTWLQTLSTSSKLLEFVKSVGEDYPMARPMVERAEREEDPKLIEPFDMAQLIQNEEYEIRAYMRIMRQKKPEDKRKEAEDPRIRAHEDGGMGEVEEKDIGGTVGEERRNEKDGVDGKAGKGEEHKPDSQEVAKEDDKGELKAYYGPVSTSSTHAASLTQKFIVSDRVAFQSELLSRGLDEGAVLWRRRFPMEAD
jgi:hypothetical protein